LVRSIAIFPTTKSRRLWTRGTSSSGLCCARPQYQGGHASAAATLKRTGPGYPGPGRDCRGAYKAAELAVAGVQWLTGRQRCSTRRGWNHRSGEETRLTALIAGLQQSVDERQTALKAKQTESTELKERKLQILCCCRIEKRGVRRKMGRQGDELSKAT